jgi:putative transposase
MNSKPQSAEARATKRSASCLRLSPLRFGSRSGKSSGTKHSAKGWHQRGYLPHCDKPGLFQGITFRLYDSVPASVIAAWKRELKVLLNPRNEARVEYEKQRKELHRRLAEYEDAGHGACHLRREDIAAIVEAALHHFDATRYDLIAWCIMPNHVHTLIRTYEDWPVGHAVQSWKRHTARAANQLLGGDGTFWARDYYDRYLRDEPHYWRAVDYIHHNPVKAGLCATPTDWSWSSARHWSTKRLA